MKKITLKKISFLFFAFFLSLNTYSENFKFSENEHTTQTVTLVSSSEFIIDSNQSCVDQGPRSSYVSYKFCNTTGSTLTDVSANFAISGAAGFSLAGNQPANQLIGNLEAGECVTLFWYVGYPCAPENQTASITVNLIDDGAPIASSTDVVSTKEAISASATGNLGNITINNSSIGQLTTMDVEYIFGTTNGGGYISFQPVGNANFNADCFQLIGFEVTQSDFTCIPPGTKDDMYFQLPQNCSVNGSSNTVNVRYYFKNKCTDTSSDIRPYAYGSSGNQLKYTGNFNEGTSLKTLPPSAAPTLTISKVASENHFETVPATVKYTVTLTNTSALPSTIDSLSDELPSPFSFDALDGTSDITTINSSKYPSSSDTGTLLFEGGKDSGIYPYTEYYIAGNESISLVYTVAIPSTTVDGTYQNSVTYSVGKYTSDPVSSSVTIGPALFVTANDDDFTNSPIESASGGTTSSVFNDNGNGTDNANGTPANNSNIDNNISIINNGGLTGATINTDGTINVPANIAEGTYTLTYQICLGLDNTVCDTAQVTIKVVNPKIGLAKETTSVVTNNDGSYTVNYLFTVENFGDVALSNISITDDIINQFSGMNPSAFTATSGTLSANATWDGTSGSNILASGQSLAIGASGTVSISFVAIPTTSGTINNTATASGLSPLNTTITDISTEGTDPDGIDNDNNPDEDIPTPTIFPENPKIGLAKNLVSSTNNNDGTFRVTYLLTVENFGNVDLSNLYITDDIISQFSGMNPTEFSATSGTLTADTSGWWNGSGDRNILLGNQSLAVGASGNVSISFTVTPGIVTTIDNTANVTATSPLSTIVSDISTDGLDADGSDNDNLPDESVPTPTPFIQNFLPSATNDVITVNENTSNNIIDVLDNDSFGNDGPNSGSIALPSNTSTNGGTLSIDDNSTPNDPTDDKILYTPATNFNGSDSFTYTITDSNGDIASATVTVTVAIVENPSIGLAKNVESIVNNNNGTYTITYLFTIENFGNVDLFNLFLSDDIVSQFTGLDATNYSVTNGTLNGDTTGWWNGSANRNILLDGQSLAAGATGTVYVTFTVTPGLVANVDNSATITAYTAQNVSITDISTDGLDPDGIDNDNNPDESTPTPTTLFTTPLLAVDDSAVVDQNSSNNLIDVLDNDSYGSIGASLTHPLTFLNGSLSHASANGGAVVIDDNNTPNDFSDDVVLYTPVTDFVGIDTFQYVITDANGNAASATVTVTVNPVGTSATPTAVDDIAMVDKNSTGNTIDVLLNDSSGSDGYIDDGLRMPNGTFSSASTEGGLISINTNGTPNTSDDVFIYTPPANFTGTDTFSYTITDASGDAATATVTVTVTAVTDVPTALDDSFSVVEGSSNNHLDILANDTFGSDGYAAINPIIAITPTANGGSVFVTDNALLGNPTDDTILYTPASNFVGTDTFSYILTDANGDTSTATVTVTVTAAPIVNGTPTAVDDTETVVQDSANNLLNVLVNDDYGTDGANATHPITFSNGSTSNASSEGGLVSIVDDNGVNKISYSPAKDFVGTDTITYVITDANGDASTATVTVTVTSNGGISTPTAVDDAETVAIKGTVVVDVLANDSSGSDGYIDGGLTFTNGTLVSASTKGGAISINNNGTLATSDDAISYTAFKGAIAGDTDTFQYTITDASGDASTATVTITITGAATDVPTAADDTATATENTSETIAVLGNDSFGTDGRAAVNHLTVGGTSANGGTTVVSGDDIIYTPATDFKGVDTFTYTIEDSTGDTSTATVTVTVNHAVVVNGTPTAVNDVYDGDDGFDRYNWTSSDPIIYLTVLDNDDFGTDGAMTAHHALNLINGKIDEVSAQGRRIRIDDNGTPTDYSDDRIAYYATSNLTVTSDSFTYYITDNSGDATSATVTINYIDVAPPKTGDSTDKDENTVDNGLLVLNEFTAYPNPSQGRLTTAVYSKENTKAILSLYDVRGVEVYRGQLDLKPGKNIIENEFRVKSGVMFLKIYNSETNYGVKRIVFK